MSALRHLLLVLTGLWLVAPGSATAAVYFLPGNEGAVVDLLRPHSDEDLTLEGWTLQSLEVGPLCEVRFAFDGGGDSVRAVIRPVDDLGGLGFTWAPTRPGTLGDALEALVRGNASEDFFADVCERKTDPVKGNVTDGGFPVAGNDGAYGAWGPVFVLLRILLVAGLSAFGLILLGRGRPAGAAAPPAPGLRAEPAWVKLVFLLGLGVRALAMVFEPSHFFELEHVPPETFERLLAFVARQAPFFLEDGLTVTGKVFHTPALQFLLYPWHALGDLLGAGGTLLWIRLPNLFLAGWLMILLLRAGRHLGQTDAGRAALVLFALIPQAVDISVQMGHYFPEAVLSAWFLERLLAATVRGREVWRRVAIAGAAALWSGFIAWPLVGIGALAGAIHLWRGGRRRDLLALVLAMSALATPLIGTALDAGTIYDASCVPLESLDGFDGVVPVYKDHPIFGVSEPTPAGAVLAPWRMARYLYDPVTAALAIAGLVLLILWRSGAARVPLLALLFYGYARTRMNLNLDQLRLLVPLMLFLPAWGLAATPELRLPRLPALNGRRLLVAFTLVALIGGAFSPVSRPESGRDIPSIGFYRGLVQRIGGANIWGIRLALQAEDRRDHPVVTLSQLRFRQVCSCYGFSRHLDLRRCLESVKNTGYPDGISVAADVRRDVVELPELSCAELGRLLEAPPWTAEVFFLLVPASLSPEGWPGCLDTIGVRCDEGLSTTLLRLHHCERVHLTAPGE
jgi:hypothetical protein